MLLISYFYFYRVLSSGFLLLAGSGHIDSVGSSVFVGFMGEYLDRPACSIGEHSGSQSSCPWVRRIRAVAGIRQGPIEYDAPVMPRVLHDHSGYGAFEGHVKEDITSKSLNLPSPILLKEATKNPCSLDDFLVVEMLIKRRITAHTRWSGGIRMFPCISTSRNTIVLKRRGS